MNIIAKAFWRIILPLIGAVILATVRMPDLYGRWGSISLIVDGVVFLGLIAVSLRNSFRWAKEAEDYEDCFERRGRDREGAPAPVFLDKSLKARTMGASTIAECLQACA